MSDFSITVIVPVLNRPQNVERLIKSFLLNSPNDKVSMLFVTAQSLQEEIDEINKFKDLGSISIGIAPEDVVPWSMRINWGINHTTSPWLLCGADDVVFHPSWFEEAEIAAKDFDGVIGTNDLGHPATIAGSHTTHPLVSRKYVIEQGTLDEKGKFCHEGYQHNYVDVEFVATAKQRGCWRHAPKCIIEHIHPAWNKATWDPVYQKGQDNWNHDRALLIARGASLKFNY